MERELRRTTFFSPLVRVVEVFHASVTGNTQGSRVKNGRGTQSMTCYHKLWLSVRAGCFQEIWYSTLCPWVWGCSLLCVSVTVFIVVSFIFRGAFAAGGVQGEEAKGEGSTGGSCIVCFGDYTYGEELCRLRCGHMYHAKVRRHWRRQYCSMLACDHRGPPVFGKGRRKGSRYSSEKFFVSRQQL